MASLTYSLWILPPADLERRLAGLHARIRRRIAGPAIMPHLTVGGGFDTDYPAFKALCEDRCSELAASRVILEAFGFSDAFFRALYVGCSVSKAVHDMRNDLYTLFDEPGASYTPHISLYYGRADERAKIDAAAMETCPQLSFDVRRLALASNDEENLEWRIMDEFEI